MTDKSPPGLARRGLSEGDSRGDGPETELLTVEEVARLLRVPKATIYRWRSTGEGPRGYSIGRYVRFRWPDVEAWLEERANEPAAEPP
jgi:excisionase family DNA binding protein